MVEDLKPGIESSGPVWLVATGGRLFFTADDGEHGYELWTSDGTREGTTMVADLAPGPDDSDPDRLTSLPGGVFFTADDGVHGREPWFSDGNSAGTSMLGDLRSGGEPSLFAAQVVLGASSRDWAPFDGRALFAARDDTHGRELWSSDGTSGGTVLLADLSTGGADRGSDARGFTEMGGLLYFSADTATDGGELWVTDGVSDTHG